MSPASLRVLVVDDNEDSARSFFELLLVMGHQCEFKTDPKEVMDTARAFRPDLVLLDIGMPDVDGHQVARLLRREFGAELPDPGKHPEYAEGFVLRARVAAAGKTPGLSLAEQLFQQPDRYRLHQVQLEAYRPRSRQVFILPERRERNHARAFQLRILLDLAADLETVHAGQAEIEEYEVGAEAARYVESHVAVDGVFDVMAHVGEQEGEGVNRVEIVFDDQNPLGCGGLPYHARARAHHRAGPAGVFITGRGEPAIDYRGATEFLYQHLHLPVRPDNERKRYYSTNRRPVNKPGLECRGRAR